MKVMMMMIKDSNSVVVVKVDKRNDIAVILVKIHIGFFHAEYATSI